MTIGDCLDYIESYIDMFYRDNDKEPKEKVRRATQADFDKFQALQLREKFGISKKENLRDCFSEEELKSIQSMENLVSGLVDCGWGYDKVKAFIENTNTKHLQIA